MTTHTLTVTNHCTLTNVPPPLLNELKHILTLENPKYRDAVKYGRWVGKKLKRKLTFYTAKDDTITFPRGFANQAVLICRKHNFTITIIDKRTSRQSVELEFNGSLRPYQKKACDAVLEREFGVLEAATGSGKTVMAAYTIAKRRQPTLILIHTKELLYQWRDRIETFLDKAPALIGDGSYEIGPVTVGLIHTVRKRLDDLPCHFGHIVVDEAHRTPSSMFTEIIKTFDCRYMLGLSATPFRRDGLTELIYWHIGDLVHRVSAKELDQHGAVLKPVITYKKTAFTFNYRRNYQDLMAALTQDSKRNDLIVADICREVKKATGTALVVSDRVAHCEALCEILAERGVQAQLLTGRLSSDERSVIVNDVQQGRTKVLVATIQLIGEGFDCPGLTTLFLSTPIKFTGRLTQVIGRILRPAAGKTPKVFDYLDPVGVLEASAKVRQQVYEQ